MLYNWQQHDWRTFSPEPAKFEQTALQCLEAAGQGTGMLHTMNEEQQGQMLITLLVKEAVQTSAIEGELISRTDVISSIKKNLGYAVPSGSVRDKRSEGIAELLVKSRTNFAQDLDEMVLFDWHRCLLRGNYSVDVGVWRSHVEPMQVVSGGMGREIVHFEAPLSAQVPTEMAHFFDWFNATKPTGNKPITNPIIRSAIAHLYFASIHPFEDGNGRIGRVIAEKALSQNLGRPILLSLSATIEARKNAYYDALQMAQTSNQCDYWIAYFGEVILQSQRNFVQSIAYSLKKARFFDAQKNLLNERQLKVVSRMLAEEEDAFAGGMNARKYLAIAKTSKATATRDLQDLVVRQILSSKGGGRSTNYQINLGV